MQCSFAPMHVSTNRASSVRGPLGASPSPRCCRAAVPVQGRRTTLPLAAGANPGPAVTTSHPATSTPSVSGRAAARQHLPVISLLSACVEVNDACRQFEQAAGRSAMVGFVVAVAVELVTNQGLFDHWSAGGLLMFAATASLCVLAGAAVASMDQQRPLLNLKLREAVLSSLTAAKRSSASVTQAQVDKPVDYLMETAFAELIFNVFEEEFLA